MPDLSLPSTILEMERYHDRPMALLPFAVYAIADLSDTELHHLIQSAAESCDKDNRLKLPPRYHFPDTALTSIVDHHIQLVRDNSFDPRYFIVAVNTDWKKQGVLMVTLDDDDVECKPDSFVTRTEGSALTLINLQIGNLDWYEAKEIALSGQESSGNTNAEKEALDGEDYGEGPPSGKYIQAYTTSSVD